MPTSAIGKWLLRRDVAGHTIIVKGVSIPRTGSFGLTCSVDGEVTDFRQAENFVTEAQDMIRAVILELDLIKPALTLVS